MKKNFRLFFDMDDTLVKFGDTKADVHILDRMYEKGFFENLEPLPLLHEVNKVASLFPENIFILSACLNSEYCKPEKILWLKKYLPAAMKENVIFTTTRRKKSSYVAERFYGNRRRKLSRYDILIDDYGKNISEWEAAGGTAIKFKNDFNMTTGKTYKYVIRDFSELLNVIESIRNDLDTTKSRKK